MRGYVSHLPLGRHGHVRRQHASNVLLSRDCHPVLHRVRPLPSPRDCRHDDIPRRWLLVSVASISSSLDSLLTHSYAKVTVNHIPCLPRLTSSPLHLGSMQMHQRPSTSGAHYLESFEGDGWKHELRQLELLLNHGTKMHNDIHGRDTENWNSQGVLNGEREALSDQIPSGLTFSSAGTTFDMPTSYTGASNFNSSLESATSSPLSLPHVIRAPVATRFDNVLSRTTSGNGHCRSNDRRCPVIELKAPMHPSGLDLELLTPPRSESPLYPTHAIPVSSKPPSSCDELASGSRLDVAALLVSNQTELIERPAFNFPCTPTASHALPVPAAQSSNTVSSTGGNENCRNRKSRGEKKKGSASTASRFCHICSRTSKMNRVVCSNFLRGKCRKSICEMCFSDNPGWDWERALSPDSNWTCPHCRHMCNTIPKARCLIYGVVNERRRCKRLASQLKKEHTSLRLATFAQPSSDGTGALPSITNLTANAVPSRWQGGEPRIAEDGLASQEYTSSDSASSTYRVVAD
jgi:Zinc-finger domain of monoamine-oxidase A repressor R1